MRARVARTQRGAVGFLVLVILIGVAGVSRADEVYTNWRGFAVKGYDPVAYFTRGEPVEGSSEHSFEWSGAEWRFASAENLARFMGDPERYAPQYGGYCAYAVTQGNKVSTDPEVWKIVDDKLYLNYSKDVQALWVKDIPGFIAKADNRWPEIRTSR